MSAFGVRHSAFGVRRSAVLRIRKGIEDSAVGCRRSAGEEIEDSAIRLSAVGCWRSAGEGIEDSAVGCRLSAVHRKVKIMKEVKEEVSKKK